MYDLWHVIIQCIVLTLGIPQLNGGSSYLFIWDLLLSSWPQPTYRVSAPCQFLFSLNINYQHAYSTVALDIKDCCMYVNYIIPLLVVVKLVFTEDNCAVWFVGCFDVTTGNFQNVSDIMLTFLINMKKLRVGIYTDIIFGYCKFFHNFVMPKSACL